MTNTIVIVAVALVAVATAQMTLVGYKDAFCTGAQTWSQTYNPGQCYKEKLFGRDASYTASCTTNKHNGLCAEITAYGKDSTCSSQVRPEAFPCDYCLSFVPGVFVKWTDCDTNTPKYQSGCTPGCGHCLVTTSFGQGACHDLETLGNVYYSLNKVTSCNSILEFDNTFGSTCSGIHAYTQPVPIGLCLNGTRATSC